LRPWEEETQTSTEQAVSSYAATSQPQLHIQTAGSHKRKYSDDDAFKLRQLSKVAVQAAAQPVSESKSTDRYDSPEDDVSGDASSTQPAKSHRCPYYVRDKTGRTHPKCADRSFPNPRKLKEHVWQSTRPYKCSTCLFGFGRDKTRAIHVKERKKGCKPPPPGSALLRESYENSPEHIRDQRIEAARTTAEIVEILNDYDKQKGPDARPSYDEEEGSEVGSQEDDSNYQRVKFPESEHSRDSLSRFKLTFGSQTSPVLRMPEVAHRFTPLNGTQTLTPPHSRTSSQTHFSLSPRSPVHRQITMSPANKPDMDNLTLPPLKLNMQNQAEKAEMSWALPRFNNGILSS